MDLEALHMIRSFMTDDHKGAAQAFVEKRAPTFTGRQASCDGSSPVFLLVKRSK